MLVKSLTYGWILCTIWVRVVCLGRQKDKETDLTQRTLRSERRGRGEEGAAPTGSAPLRVASLRGSCSFCFGRRARFSTGRNNRPGRWRPVRAGRSGFRGL